MKIYNNPSQSIWKELCTRPTLELDFLDSVVKNILARVKKSGDYALREFSYQYDKVQLENLFVSPSEVEEAVALVPPQLKQAIEVAYGNIKKFHAAQHQPDLQVETMPGVVCERRNVPIQKVGIYIPGGSAPLFSTVLMLATPANLAGCPEIILCTPPMASGKVNPAILFAASLTGVTRIYKVGGTQAIGALAYGTESIPRVHKIFGPGNQYVTKAKQLVALEGMAIDLPAGPSEVLVYADATANAAFVAADLLSQAEHGTDSQVVLATTSEASIKLIMSKLEAQLQNLPRKEIARTCLNNSMALAFDSASKAFEFINEYAPEHLIVNTATPRDFIPLIQNAGSVFLGGFTPESLGDYASGTNHTLPTNGFAKAYSGVSLSSFQKSITYQTATKNGLKNIGPVVEQMAAAENLEAHKNAVSIRLSSITE